MFVIVSQVRITNTTKTFEKIIIRFVLEYLLIWGRKFESRRW